MAQRIFCVTGTMASGKNTVCSFLEQQGFFCIDFDFLVHQEIESCSKRIIAEFSDAAASCSINLCAADGKIDRRALGKLLFLRPDLLAVQESIVYPGITERAHGLAAQSGASNIVYNAAVLYKIPELLNECSCVIFTKAPFFKRLLRVRKRDGLSLWQTLRRFYSQKGLLLKYRQFSVPVYVIHNNSTLAKLNKRLTEFLKKLK